MSVPHRERAMSTAEEPLVPAGVSVRKPRHGDLFELTVDGLDERGDGLARMGEYEFTLRWALPGDRVRAKVLSRRRNAIEARVEAWLERSTQRVTPRCAHFGVCGGCTLQSLGYEQQLGHKQRHLERVFAAHGLDPAVLQPLVGSPQPWHYRGKMEFSFGNRRWRTERDDAAEDFALGLHVRDVYSKVVEVEQCSIQAEACNAILASLRREARARGLAPWDLRRHTGFLRHAVLRSSRSSGELLLNLVTAGEEFEVVDAYLAAVRAVHPELTSAVQTVHTRAAYGALAGVERVVFGAGRIEEQLLGLRFEISAQSFFQAHVAQAERLFAALIEALALRGDDVVHDLYCGTGTITLLLARAAREAVGFELVEAAVENARASAVRNGIRNARFHAGDVLTAWAREADSARVLVVDPPRAGLHAGVLAQLKARGPERIGYIACNPSAGARDVAQLVAAGWKLTRAQGFDLFPHTPHVECLMVLERA
jgi:23S rRNA (uracil1939-C5)-methyltransferase